MKKPKRRRTKLALILIPFVVLGALTIPDMLRNQLIPGRFSVCKTNLHNIATALELYADDSGGHYPRNLNQLVPNYLMEIPSCPGRGGVSYRVDFGPNPSSHHQDGENSYLIECTGVNHGGRAFPPDYPKYDGICGLWER